MDGPVITITAGETLWIDGRAVIFETAARVQLPRFVRFLRGRDVIQPAPDGSPLHEAYLAVQAAHLAQRGDYLRHAVIAQAKLEALAEQGCVEAALALRALALHRPHHALLALRPLLEHNAGDDAAEPAAAAMRA